MISKQTGLSNVQLELLKIFGNNVSDKELYEIRLLLSNYFAEKATAEMDKIWEERGIKPEDMETWANERNRAKSRH